jgi:beta-N-acetylhexosaminidase
VATGVPLVAVTLRAPWDADAYPGLGTVLATYGVQAPTLAALATVLVGAGPTTGRLPVAVATAD